MATSDILFLMVLNGSRELEQKKVLELVRTLKAQNVPVIIISHQMHDVFAVTDRVLVMRRGQKAGERVVKDTTPEEVVGLIVGSVEK